VAVPPCAAVTCRFVVFTPVEVDSGGLKLTSIVHVPFGASVTPVHVLFVIGNWFWTSVVPVLVTLSAVVGDWPVFVTVKVKVPLV
jgi:hypothetical protein